MDSCREQLRKNQEELRKLKLQNKLSAFGLMMLQGGEASQSFESMGIPEGLDRIYLLSQIQVDEDIMCGPTQMKKIQTFLEHIHKNYKKFAKKKVEDIEQFIGESEANRLLYICNYIFIPTDYQMDCLVLKAACLNID